VTQPSKEIRREEIGGIPIFWAESELPFLAALVFRVGRADERLARAGITHLVEHLALPAQRLAGVEFNGQVGATTTLFWATGERDAVLRWLEATSSALAKLPLGRLEAERSILLTEAESWSPGHPGAPRRHSGSGLPDTGS
jgi:hypothetical protein